MPRRLVAVPLIVALLPAAGFAQPDRVAREVLVDGHVMHFEISGRADGPTVVFEAGAQTTLRTWFPRGPAVDSTLAQAAASDPLPPIPVVVLTRDDFGRDPPELGQLWTEVNRAWAAQMPTARHVVVPHSGHRIQMDRPAVVAEIVRGVLARARAPAHPEGPQDESSP